MSGNARAPDRPTPPPPMPSGGGQILPPLRRHLAFTSTKPPFLPPDDYHRFSGDAHRAADQEAEAIVVRSPVSHVNLVPINLYVYIACFVGQCSMDCGEIFQSFDGNYGEGDAEVLLSFGFFFLCLLLFFVCLGFPRY